MIEIKAKNAHQDFCDNFEGASNRYEKDFAPFSHGNIKKIGFIYTYRCPISCSNCCFECGPERNEKLELNLARRCIIEAAKQNCNDIVFSGGECLLFIDDIITLIREAALHDMKPQVVTNAYWATTKENTRSFIGLLINAGLKGLTISVDSFHQKFVPLDNVLRAIEELQERKIPVIVRMHANGNHDEELDHIAVSVRKQVYSTLVEIVIDESRPYGRWKKHKFGKPYHSKNQTSVCRSVFRPIVFPNGDVFCCCEPSIYEFLVSKENPCFLFLGSLYKYSFREIIKVAEMSPVLNALRIGGAKALLDIWGDGTLKLKSQLLFSNHCDFCVVVNKALGKQSPHLVEYIHADCNKDIRLHLQECWKKRSKLFSKP